MITWDLRFRRYSSRTSYEYIPYLVIWIFLQRSIYVIRGQDTDIWDGCIGTTSVDDTELCYDLLEEMDGLTAGKHCASSNLTAEFYNSTIVGYLKNYLQLPKPNGTAGDRVWIGGIEKFKGSNSYAGYYGPPYEEDCSTGGQCCLALDPSSDERIIRSNCNEKLQRLCIYKKFQTVVYDGETVCGKGAVVAVQDCYVIAIAASCLLTKIWMDIPRLSADEIMTNIKSRPLRVDLLQLHQGKTILTKSKSTVDELDIILCYLKKGPSNTIRLELRHNNTARAPALWVGGRGRAAHWPPTCVGAHVPETRGDPVTLHLALAEGAEAAPVVWCYAIDIITDEISVSNSVPRNDPDSCAKSAEPLGFPVGWDIDENASCMECLIFALNACESNVTCNDFRNISTELTKIKDDMDGADLVECGITTKCVRRFYWNFTTEDCNGDGLKDCDDRFAQMFNRNCAFDPRKLTNIESRYWACRTNTTRDFVDFLGDGDFTIRYYCEDRLDSGRTWSDPIHLPGDSPYGKEMSSKTLMFFEAKNTLRNLDSLSSRTSLSETDMEAVVQNFSTLFSVHENALRDILIKTNTSSLTELLDTFLLKTESISTTTNILAVSKNVTAGFKLFSDNPSVKNGTFGTNPNQHSINSLADIYSSRNQVEAAIFIDGLPPDTTLVMVTFANKREFIPCTAPLDSRSAISNKSDKSTSPLSNGSNGTDSTWNVELREKYCPQTHGIIRGCINSHVVNVALESNQSYVQLQEGKQVSVVLRSQESPSAHQRIQCVYWHTEKRGWAYDGCALIQEEGGLVTCRCNHLTHFAQLITDADAMLGPDAETLRVVTICCSALSITAYVGILVTGAVVREWRRKKENVMMINLAAAFSLYLAMFLYATISSKPTLDVGPCPPQEKTPLECKVKGVALHYLVLSSFWWMFIAACTHYLRLATIQQLRIVSHYVLKSMLVGWGVPLLPVAVLIAVDSEAYAGRGRDFCYPTGVAFYTAVLLPILVVFVVNGIIFLLILRSLFPKLFFCWVQKTVLKTSGTNRTKALFRKLLACVVLTFLFGLTWYSGLISFTIVPAYFVSISVGLQGPLLFIMFVLGEQNIRKKLCSYLGAKRDLSSARTVSSNTS